MKREKNWGKYIEQNYEYMKRENNWGKYIEQNYEYMKSDCPNSAFKYFLSFVFLPTCL